MFDFLSESGTSDLSGMLGRRFQNILSGKKKPWELPEFAGFAEQLRRTGALSRQGLGRQLTAQGVRGPALATTMGQAQEREMQPMGGLLTRMYDQASEWARHEDQMKQMDLARQLQGFLGLGELREQRKGRKSAGEGINLGILGRWGG